MGCSMTEGVGCYNEFYIEKNLSAEDLTHEHHWKYLNRFHEYGYPNELGRLLNYDKVINLGLAGSAPLSNVKYFFERYLEKNFSDYEVLIFWMIPDCMRTSYYFKGRIHSRIPFSKYGDDFDKEYQKLYLNYEYPYFNSSLDIVFGIKVMEQVCQNKGYNLLLSSTNQRCEINYKRIYPSANYLSEDEENIFQKLDKNTDFAPCHHPNERGYKKTAKIIFNIIEKNYPHLINKNKVEKFEWLWDGYILEHDISSGEYKNILRDYEFNIVGTNEK